jgi:hypothetical protein
MTEIFKAVVLGVPGYDDVFHDKHIHIGSVETIPCMFWRIYDRFIFIERCIQ